MNPSAHNADVDGMILRKVAVAAQAVRVGARKPAAAPPPQATQPPEAAPEVDRAALIEAAREEARTQGYAEGFASGDKEARRELSDRRASLERLIESIEGAREAALVSVEDVALGIAWEAVCRILGEVVATREGIRALVEQGAAKVRSEERMVVRLCPADLEVLGGGAESLDGGSTRERTDFLADASIALGGCVIETGAGRIDATLETQLSRLREALLAARLARRETRP